MNSAENLGKATYELEIAKSIYNAKMKIYNEALQKYDVEINKKQED